MLRMTQQHTMQDVCHPFSRRHWRKLECNACFSQGNRKDFCLVSPVYGCLKDGSWLSVLAHILWLTALTGSALLRLAQCPAATASCSDSAWSLFISSPSGLGSRHTCEEERKIEFRCTVRSELIFRSKLL